MCSSEIHLPTIDLSSQQRIGSFSLSPRSIPQYTRNPEISQTSFSDFHESPKSDQSLPTVLRFDNIDAVASALAQFSTPNDNLPIIKYPDNFHPEKETPVISTEQYHFYYPDLEAQTNKKKHFVRREALIQQIKHTNEQIPTATKDRTQERYILEKGNNDPRLNWTRPNIPQHFELIEPNN
jgi:hypothetical protein